MKLQIKAFALRRWLAGALATRNTMRLRTGIILALAIFSLSYAIRSLHAVDLAQIMYTAVQPFSGLTAGYDKKAALILEGGGVLGPYNIAPSETEWISRSPGYSAYLSVIYAAFGRNFFTVQAVQNGLNSISPVLIFLIAGQVISWRVGIASGLLAAVSHHMGYISNFILPDSLCALPVLAAMLFLIKAQRLRRRAYWFYALAGLMIGISAWLRSQAMLMGLFFLVVLTLISERRMRTIAQTAVMAAVSLLVITPITIKNYVVYGEFVPINIGMGIVLLEGIGESSDGRFGAPVTDLEVAEQEAILYGNPEYAGSWSTPDGIMRDRDRIKRSLDIIAGHPVWYAGVMLKRMARMVKYSADAELVHTGVAPDPDQKSEPVRREWRRLDQNSSPLILGRSLGWMRPLARAAQRAAKETLLLFILVGTALMFIVGRRRAMLILLVPVYYFISQSFLHTEFRYTLPMQYFLFVPAAIVWVLVMIGIWRSGKKLLTRWSPKSSDLPAL